MNAQYKFMTSLQCYCCFKGWFTHFLKYPLSESPPECRTMEQSQRHQGNATVDVAKPLWRQDKRACVVRRETTQAKTQKQNQLHPRYWGGSWRKREAVYLFYLFFILRVQLGIAMADKYICVRNWHPRKNSQIADIVSRVCEQRRSYRTQIILSVTGPSLDSVSSYFAA